MPLTPAEEASQIRRWLWARFVNLMPPPSERVVTLHEAPEDAPADYHVTEALQRIAQAAAQAEREAVAQEIVALSDYTGRGCRDAAHDDRWCRSCEDRNDALEEAADAIRVSREQGERE